MLVAASDLVEDPLLLSLLVHSDDFRSSIRGSPGNVEPGVGDEGGVAGGDSQSYGLHHGSLFSFIGPEPCKLGFFFQHLEVGSSRAVAHSQVKHLLFMDLLNGGVPELDVDHV